MNIKSIALTVLNIVLCSALLYAADDNLFKRNNPDGLKYEFARSFITSIGYLEVVEKRWKKSDAIKNKGDESGFIQWNFDRLAKDNMDLRVAKNYMVKYFSIANPLMRKVVDSYAYSCDQLIDLNHRERELWEQLRSIKKENNLNAIEDKKFVEAQEKLAVERKSMMRGIVEVSVLMSKVLLSEDVKEKQVRKRLALTSNERDKLIKKLDTFAGDNLDWGMKPGQTFLQGAEATIREMLEDPTYVSADE